MAMRECEICGSTMWLERHHVYNAAYRKKSEKFGAVATLCHFCHNEPPNGVHHNAENMRQLKAKYQMQIMDKYGMSEEDFIREFGKSYL
jgi:cytochrome c553